MGKIEKKKKENVVDNKEIFSTFTIANSRQKTMIKF